MSEVLLRVRREYRIDLRYQLCLTPRKLDLIVSVLVIISTHDKSVTILDCFRMIFDIIDHLSWCFHHFTCWSPSLSLQLSTFVVE